MALVAHHALGCLSAPLAPESTHQLVLHAIGMNHTGNRNRSSRMTISHHMTRNLLLGCRYHRLFLHARALCGFRIALSVRENQLQLPVRVNNREDKPRVVWIEAASQRQHLASWNVSRHEKVIQSKVAR